jgi:hypothetical protein
MSLQGARPAVSILQRALVDVRIYRILAAAVSLQQVMAAAVTC